MLNVLGRSVATDYRNPGSEICACSGLSGNIAEGPLEDVADLEARGSRRSECCQKPLEGYQTATLNGAECHGYLGCSF
jgi:hypothetical protein